MNTLIPVFAGKTSVGEEVILYRKAQHPIDANLPEYHIQRPDGELWALSPGAVIGMWEDPTTAIIHLSVYAAEWRGAATGSKEDTVSAKVRLDH